ncbi:chromosome partitioning protein ParB (plasmid) [Acetobacteraceae bacterium]|nr:chromosome partitioning protein ParB [Acetobacteraceae bacterium]
MSKKSNILMAGRPTHRSEKSVATLASLSNEKSALKRVNFQLSEELHMKLKIFATKQGKSVKEVLTEYISSLPN